MELQTRIDHVAGGIYRNVTLHVVDPHAKAKEEPKPGGPMVESRVAGRYGTHGWTVREGFAKRLE